ncbi:MAG: hypothetical protein ACJAXS_001365 [Colwellia sp.]|jgi:hypothetical protein
MIQVTIRLADGSLDEYSESDGFISNLNSLRKQGFLGKELIHQLITDDWGAPPIVVNITGTTSKGSEVNVKIPYE